MIVTGMRPTFGHVNVEQTRVRYISPERHALPDSDAIARRGELPDLGDQRSDARYSTDEGDGERGDVEPGERVLLHAAQSGLPGSLSPTRIAG